MSQGLHVLKFGGSVLRDDDAVATVARAIHTRVRAGQRLVAVVSATRGTTDRLLAEARDHGAAPDPHALAELLATGERRSASLLALALHREGVACEVADAGRLRLRTQGPPLDADPVAFDATVLRALLHTVPVVVVPGFTGTDAHGRTTLLGRGGSDLTAVFLAHGLGAGCLLVKDVPAVHAPASAPGLLPHPYAALSWDDLLALDSTVVQAKAVRFARDHAMTFRVGGLDGNDATVIGQGPSCLRAGGTAHGPN